MGGWCHNGVVVDNLKAPHNTHSLALEKVVVNYFRDFSCVHLLSFSWPGCRETLCIGCASFFVCFLFQHRYTQPQQVQQVLSSASCSFGRRPTSVIPRQSHRLSANLRSWSESKYCPTESIEIGSQKIWQKNLEKKRTKEGGEKSSKKCLQKKLIEHEPKVQTSAIYRLFSCSGFLAGWVKVCLMFNVVLFWRSVLFFAPSLSRGTCHHYTSISGTNFRSLQGSVEVQTLESKAGK